MPWAENGLDIAIDAGHPNLHARHVSPHRGLRPCRGKLCREWLVMRHSSFGVVFARKEYRRRDATCRDASDPGRSSSRRISSRSCAPRTQTLPALALAPAELVMRSTSGL